MLISRFIRLVRAWWRYNESVRELARLNDRELADIGVSRSEIPACRLAERPRRPDATNPELTENARARAGVFVCGASFSPSSPTLPSA